MHRCKDERGYALVTVLLIIVVFMIIFLSFVGRSFSSVKQNQVVERISQSVALAEMGMTHFEAAVQNIYAANQQTISNTVKQAILSDRNSISGTKDRTVYINQGVSLMSAAIKQGLANEQQSISIEGRTNSSFSLYSVSEYTDSAGNQKIILKVKGNENGKSTILSTVMTFSPTITGLTSGGTSTSSYTLPNFNSIAQPSSKDPSYCKNPASLSSLCTNIYVEGTGTFNENNSISGKTIFSTGSLTFSGNANKTENTKIHAGGNISIGKNMINAVGVTMEANGTASFGSNFTVDSSSEFYFNGKLTVDGKLDISNKSVVYVNGDAVIGNHLNMFDTSKLCVAGDLTYQKNGSKSGGILVVKGKINGVKTTVTDQEFLQKCGSPVTPVLDVQWGDRVQNQVNYEY
jgi:hypothetical protein